MATKRNRLWAIAALVGVVMGMSGCLKSKDDTPSRPYAAFSIINGIVSSTALDLYDNNQKLSASFTMGQSGVDYRAYGGTHEFVFTKTGTTTEVASDISQYDSLRYYTLVTFGDSTSGGIRPIAEDFSSLDQNAVNIRFLHLSPDIPAVDLYIGSTKVDSNLVYMNGSFNPSFKSVSNLYGASLKVTLAGTSTVVAENTSPNVSAFQNGYPYTIYLTGLKDETGPLQPKVNDIPSAY